MSTEIGSVYLSVGASTDGFAKDVGKMFNAAAEQGGASGAESGNGFIAGFKKLLLGGAILAVAKKAFDGVKDVVAGSFSVGSEMEGYTKQLQIMTGSADMAGVMLKDLYDFAQGSVLDTKSVVAAAKTIAGYGVEASKATELTKLMGNTAAVTGGDMGGLSTVMGQVMASGKMNAQDAMQFINQGVGIFDLLSKSTGKTAAELKANMDKVPISAQMVQDALQQAYGDPELIKQFSDTGAAAMANLEDSLDSVRLSFMGVKLGASGFEASAGGLQTAIKKLLNTAAALFQSTPVQAFAEKAGNALAVVVNGVSALMGAVTAADGQMGPAMNRLGKIASALGDVGSAVSSVASIVTTGDFTSNPLFDEDSPLVGYLLSLHDVLSKIGSAVKGAFSGGQNLAQGFAGALSSALSYLAGWLSGDGASMVVSGMLGLRTKILEVVLDAIPQIVGILTTAVPVIVSSLASIVTSLASSLVTAVQVLSGAIPEIASSLIDGVMQALTVLVPTLLTMVPQLVQAGITLFTGLVTAAANIAGNLITTLSSMLPGVVSMIVGFAPQILAAGMTALESLITAVAYILPPLIDAVVGLSNQLVDTLLGMLPTLIDTGIQLFSSLLTAVTRVLPTLLGAIVSMISPIVTTLTGMLPTLVAAGFDLFTGLVDALFKVLPDLIAGVLAILPQVTKTLLDMLPDLLQTAVMLFMGLVTAVIQIIPDLIAAVIEMLPAIIDTLMAMIPQLIQTGITLFMALVDALIKMTPELLVAIAAMLPKIAAAIIKGVPQLLTSGLTLLQGLLDGLVQKAPEVWEWAKALPGKLLGAMGDLASKLWNSGRDIVQGIVNGIAAAGGAVRDKLLSIARSALDAVKSFFGIHSPSTVFRDQIGLQLGAGLVVGLDKSEDDVTDAAERLADAAMPNVSLATVTPMTRMNTRRMAPVYRGEDDDLATGGGVGLMAKLDAILDAIEAGHEISVDGRALVAATKRHTAHALQRGTLDTMRGVTWA